jgi:hypothetical protein
MCTAHNLTLQRHKTIQDFCPILPLPMRAFISCFAFGIYLGCRTKMGSIAENVRLEIRVLRRLALHPKIDALLVTRCVLGFAKVLVLTSSSGLGFIAIDPHKGIDCHPSHVLS